MAKDRSPKTPKPDRPANWPITVGLISGAVVVVLASLQWPELDPAVLGIAGLLLLLGCLHHRIEELTWGDKKAKMRREEVADQVPIVALTDKPETAPDAVLDDPADDVGNAAQQVVDEMTEIFDEVVTDARQRAAAAEKRARIAEQVREGLAERVDRLKAENRELWEYARNHRAQNLVLRELASTPHEALDLAERELRARGGFGVEPRFGPSPPLPTKPFVPPDDVKPQGWGVQNTGNAGADDED